MGIYEEMMTYKERFVKCVVLPNGTLSVDVQGLTRTELVAVGVAVLEAQARESGDDTLVLLAVESLLMSLGGKDD